MEPIFKMKSAERFFNKLFIAMTFLYTKGDFRVTCLQCTDCDKTCLALRNTRQFTILEYCICILALRSINLVITASYCVEFPLGDQGFAVQIVHYYREYWMQSNDPEVLLNWDTRIPSNWSKITVQFAVRLQKYRLFKHRNRVPIRWLQEMMQLHSWSATLRKMNAIGIWNSCCPCVQKVNGFF